MKNKLLILTPENGKVPSKTLDKDLNVISSYPSGMKEFYFDEIEYDDFHKALKKVFTLKDSFIVLGSLTELGQNYLELEKAGLRRKKGEKATIKDNHSTEMVLDLDDHILEDFNPLEPELAIEDFLEEHEINCDVTWQITSSQKLPTKENQNPLARIRLFFVAHKRFSLQYRKAWSQMVPESDGSVYTCSQPIYTAPPQIVGKDPIPKRSGFIKGKRKTFIIPKMDTETVEVNSSYMRGSEYDFEDHNIPEEVLSGRVYRRYFMPLAFHYANKIQERDAIFYIIAGKAQKVKGRTFIADNTYQYIDDAINQVEREKEELAGKIETPEEDNKDIFLPNFPKNILSKFPEPWNMIWENFKSVPRQLEEPLLLPTILSLNGYFLRAKFVTEYGRRPNLFFLNLTPSTGNKDVNSKNVIREIDQIFKRSGKTFSMFSGILNSESSITADSTFLQSFTEEEELFWINTEATRIFQQIKQAGGVSAVAALSDKLIEVVDGYEITGKTKAGGKVKTIADPNCQILFYAQPETIERFIDDEMVDSGLFGRSLISIIPEVKIKESEFSMFSTEKRTKTNITQEFIDFYSDNIWLMNGMDEGKVTLKIDEKGQNKLDNWARKEILPFIQDNDTFHKLLTRLGNSAEQLYCIVLGICQMWDKYKKRDVRKSIDIDCIIPLLNYWKETKIYAVKNLVNTELDPLAEGVLEVIEELTTGKLNLRTVKQKKVLKDYGLIPRSQVMKCIKNKAKLIRKLSSDGDKRSAIERVSRILTVFIKEQTLIEKEIDGILCIGLMK